MQERELLRECIKTRQELGERMLAAEEVAAKLREENARLRAEVKRKDDLILDCAVSDGIPLSVDAEARRIRAARSGSEERGQPMPHAFDCPCVLCDPMQVREEQQRRSERKPKP